MFDFYLDTIRGKHPGVIVGLVMALWTHAEMLRYSVRWCDRVETLRRGRAAVWFYRAIPTLMIFSIIQQATIVEQLRETAIAKGIPEAALPIVESRYRHPGYHAVLSRPDGTTMTVDFKPPKEAIKWQIQ